MTARGIARRLASAYDAFTALALVTDRLAAYRLFVRAGQRAYDAKYQLWTQVAKLLSNHYYNAEAL